MKTEEEDINQISNEVIINEDQLNALNMALEKKFSEVDVIEETINEELLDSLIAALNSKEQEQVNDIISEVFDSSFQIKSKPNNGSDILALAETGVLLNLERCDEIWCRISKQNIKGWILRDNLFGILDNELPN